ncbi:G5 domain-containing protein [Bifidobacterium gallicum]|nr:G5 domain-containing protein [Bifidobacterium gallicum]KFI59114.1 Membrane-bound transglycosylase [Bifidobacterium gallicum DSM 20093 = LMG 11596]
MTDHRAAKTPTLRSLSKRQWIKICAGAAVIASVVGGGLATRGIYTQHHQQTPTAQVTAFSATDSEAASRGDVRTPLDGTSYVKVVVNGKSQNVFGTNFTDVKSVLDAADITLEPTDTVSPALDQKVSENTTITIERADAKMQTVEQKVPFNTIRKEDPNLAKGEEKVETEGQEGILENTNLVQMAGDKVVSSNTFTSWLKKAPVDKVILVGTKTEAPKATSNTNSSSNANSSSNSNNSSSSAASSNIGTTVPVGEMQQWAHDYLLANGGTEADFTATVYIIGHESGWSVSATNPSSGAYGLPQALPGSKMGSHGADWATNYQTQLRWFWDYCKSRYGSIQGAYAFWQANHWY